jgi:D-glycero-D-manno-heptose 1,7-bisphosphate phosphatase
MGVVEVAKRPAVFLDRDGVLNESVVREGIPYPPSSVDELRIVAGALPALLELKQRGYLLLVVTNQPDVARGTQRRERVDEINAALSAALPIDGVFVCWHDDADACACRKPKPGLIFEGAKRHEVDLRASWLIGDRWRDVDAGAAAGLRTILLGRDYAERSPTHAPTAIFDTLSEAAEHIIVEG